MNASAYRRRWNFTSQADFETRMKVEDAAREKQQAARDAAAAWKPRFGVGDVIEVSGASVRIESLGAHFSGHRYRHDGWTHRVETAMTARVLGYSQTHPGYMVELVDGYAVGDGQVIVSVYVAPRHARALVRKGGAA